MPDFKNLNDLYKFLETKISESLKDNVAKKSVKVMQETIKEEVYAEYTPKMYDRHYYDSGLIDEENIETKLLDKKTLSIRNIREEDGKDIAYVVETGDGYDYLPPLYSPYDMKGRTYLQPRPFTKRTREKLKDRLAKEALKEGLQQRGVDAK